MQDWSNSFANVLELLQSCAKPSICCIELWYQIKIYLISPYAFLHFSRMRSYDDSDSVKARVMRQRAASLQYTPRRRPEGDNATANGSLSPHLEHRANGAHSESDPEDASGAHGDRDMGASSAGHCNMMSVSLHSPLALMSNGEGRRLSAGSLGAEKGKIIKENLCTVCLWK